MRHSTVALALGSNLGNSIENLRKALRQLSSLYKVNAVSSIYESDALTPENAPLEWNKNFLNAVVLVEVHENLQPEVLLKSIKDIEQNIGRSSLERWAPRIIDIDILYWRNVQCKSENLNIPHQRLLERPFALCPLLEVWPDLKSKLQLPNWASAWIEPKPFNTRVSQNYFWPKMMGVLNLTEDSFSDGGVYLDETKLAQRMSELISQGVDILDFGGESTRPNATLVNEEQELQRLEFGFRILKQINNTVEVSLDSRRASVASRILEKYKVDYLNDVEGFSSNGMRELAKASKLKCVVMHSLSVPPRADLVLSPNENPVVQINNWWSEKLHDLLSFGLDKNNLILDCGIGFGKTKAQNISLLKQSFELNSLGCEILIGHSRKSYQTLYSSREASKRDLETALVTNRINFANINYLRVHDALTQKIAMTSKGYF
jgi:2-amino-4-hydroxy-6-hydroxymethyldihydropteridine diphosphokinase / dihydropteroate synthase